MIQPAHLVTINVEALKVRGKVVVVLAWFAIVTGSSLVLSRPQNTATFEVASIKLNNSGQRGSSLPPPIGGRLTATNVSLSQLIQYAYHLQDFEISGTQGWMNSDHYDVVAKAEGNVKEEQIRLMLRPLLSDRFKLSTHFEDKLLPLYALVIGKDGVKMPRNTEDCSTVSDRQIPCGGFRIFQRRQLTGRNVPIEELVDVLAALTGRHVVNKTGLTGNFDIKLEWSPDETLAVGAESNTSPDDLAGASLFTALQQQLGLKLESQKGPVPVLVVDHAEKLQGGK
jgi:uncharacterized protein (TIGR03435 family)